MADASTSASLKYQIGAVGFTPTADGWTSVSLTSDGSAKLSVTLDLTLTAAQDIVVQKGEKQYRRTLTPALTVTPTDDGVVTVEGRVTGTDPLLLTITSPEAYAVTDFPLALSDLDGGPVNVIEPSVAATTGTGLALNDVLTATNGLWAGNVGASPVLTRQWVRDGVDVSGQMGATYTMGALDIIADAMGVRETATNVDGARSETADFALVPDAITDLFGTGAGQILHYVDWRQARDAGGDLPDDAENIATAVGKGGTPLAMTANNTNRFTLTTTNGVRRFAGPASLAALYFASTLNLVGKELYFLSKCPAGTGVEMIFTINSVNTQFRWANRRFSIAGNPAIYGVTTPIEGGSFAANQWVTHRIVFTASGCTLFENGVEADSIEAPQVALNIAAIGHPNGAAYTAQPPIAGFWGMAVVNGAASPTDRARIEAYFNARRDDLNGV